MHPTEQHTNRGGRLAGVALALLTLLVIVAYASRSGFGGNQNGGPSTTYLSYAYTAFLVLWVLAIPATIWALWMQGGNVVVERPTFKRVVIQNLLTLALICGLIGGALYLKHHGFWHKPNASGLKNSAKAVSGRHTPTVKKVEPTFAWPVALAAGVLLLVVSVPLFRAYRRERARRRARAARAGISVQHEMVADLAFVIDDLRREPDIRKAIIAAYARMEGILGRHGQARRPSDTPSEYLQRTLQSFRVRTGPATELTSLFEQARFAPHEPREPMRVRAIAALVAVRDDLEASSA
jgi:Domain of unknown function (DUF4129)